MRLEAEFFDAAMGTQPAPQVGLLVLDFDETLSVSDSTSVIISTAIREAENGAAGARCRQVASVYVHALCFPALPF